MLETMPHSPLHTSPLRPLAARSLDPYTDEVRVRAQANPPAPPARRAALLSAPLLALLAHSAAAQPAPAGEDLWAIPPADLGAEEVDFSKREAAPPRFDWDRLERESSSSHVFVEHHGYLRFRADLFHNLDLDTYSAGEQRGTSQLLPPLSSRVGGPAQEPAESLASANIRFRYEPTLHIGEQLRVHGTLDLPDNLVLGSTPDGGPMGLYARPDVPLDLLSDGQRPLADAARLRYMWGAWDSELARLEFGRMRHHWGLGLLANGGGCLDCDFGDAVDRVQATTRLFDVYVTLSWDFVAEGPSGYGVTEQIMGQAWDWDQRDDVTQYSVSLGQRAQSAAELAQQRADLKDGKSVFEWGFYGLLRTQGKAAAFLDPASAAGAPTSPLNASGASPWTLYNTRAQLVTPDLTLSWTYEPAPRKRFSARAEAVGLFGTIEQVPLATFAALDAQACEDPGTPVEGCALDQLYSPRERAIAAWGYAVELDAKVKEFRFGLHHGGASGDANSGFFGAGPLSDPQRRDSALNGFRFDRDYIVDMILFREVLGGVHNALYFKPYFGYELEKRADTLWGLKASALYALALNPQHAAGGERPLGLEVDLEAYLYEVNRFRASLAYGVLFPMAGLNLLTAPRDALLKTATTAQTLQLNIGLMF